MNKIFVTIAALCFFSANIHAQPLSQKMAETAMNLWKPERKGNWSYEQAVVLKGIECVYKNTANRDYFNYIQACMDNYVNDSGVIRTYDLEDYNIDNITGGRNLLFLYKTTLNAKYLNAVRTLRSQLQTHPRTNEGGFWHKKRYPYQMWLDGLYMGEPFYAEYAATFHEDTAFNDIARQFILMERFARNAKTGLLYHGYDESRQEQWANKTTGLSPHVWARAMGWYGMALVDALEWFPENHPKRDSLIGILNRFAAAVTKYQDAKSGLWWDIVDLPNKEKNYEEASASSMLVYTLAKGVRLGYLPEKFIPVAQKGYNGIVNKFIKTENGQVNLYGTVSVSGLGGQPYRDGSYDYYMKEKVIVNDGKGVGAFIMASSEIEMLPNLKLGKGKTVVLDNYFNHEIKKDVTGATIQHHYVWNQMDLNGYSLLGYVFNKYGVKTKSLKDAPTAQNLKGADLYLIVDPDTQKETPEPNYIQPDHIEAIYNWVKQGGVLLLFGNDSGNVELTHFNELVKRFGIQFNFDSQNRVVGSKYEMGTFTVPANHPIFKTAKKIYIKEYASQTVTPPAKAVFTDGKTVVMSVSKVGKGTVFAVGDPWFYNEYFDGRKLPADIDNYKAGEDFVKWAISQATGKINK